EHAATVEEAADGVAALARHFPCAIPSVYANEGEATPAWERQGELLQAAQELLDRVRRLAALAGAPGQGDGRLPWDSCPPTPPPAAATNATTALQPVEIVHPASPPARSAGGNPDAQPQQVVEARTPATPSPPNQYLMSWREILVTLDLKNNTESQRRVRQLN